MGKPLVSKRTIGEFIEVFSDWFVLRQIDKIFSSCDIHPAEGYESSHGTMRRSRADEYIASLDLTNPVDGAKLIDVFQQVMEYLELKTDNEFAGENATKQIKVLSNVLRADGYLYKDQVITRASLGLGLASLNKIAEKVDLDYVGNQIRRLENTVETDPEAAIGGAKELVETCCKTILVDEGVTGVDLMEVPKLIKEVCKVLKLTPEDVPETARGVDAMKRLLGSLSSLAISIAELRNEYGTGHGKHGKAKRPKNRHARLAVGGAATLATFLFETHEIKKKAESK